MRAAAVVAAVLAVTGCGSGEPRKKTTPTVVKKKKPTTPAPAPVCIAAGDAVGAIGSATGGAGGAEFCVADGADSNQCFSVDLASGSYERMKDRPVPQDPNLTPLGVRVETTPTEITVCKGDDCKTLAPKVEPSDNQLVAVANGQLAVVMLGDSEAGKGVAEVWDVAKGKKTAAIKYARGDFKCGTPRLLGNTIFISASVCAGPAARGGLYTAKGKRIGDAGGKEFGTYSEVAVQVKDDVWAFLEENAAVVALQDVTTGKVEKTIPLAPLWTSEDAPAEGDALPMGNPGETALIRGGDGKLLVISGSPSPGDIGVIDVASGEVVLIRAPRCTAAAAPAKPADAAVEQATDDERP